MRHVIVGTAGHIDHGKTHLVKRLTGIDTDRLPEEKARGISIDLGFAHWESEEFHFGVVDVPGHERFVKNMVAGATGIDLALLVVAADDGLMPQTNEHLEIMDLLGVSAGVVAVTKIDLVEPEFVKLVCAEIAERIRGTFLEGCPIIPVSSASGAGIDDLKRTLVQVARRIPWAKRGDLFRMPIDRVFSVAGHGTVVTGTVLGGEVRSGDMVELLPQRQPVRVRGVQSHGEQQAECGERQRTAINLAGVKTEELHRGQELAALGYLHPTHRLLARIRCLSSSPVALKDRVRLNLHLGTSEVSARLVLKGTAIAPGEVGYAELRTNEPIVAAYGQRFILRRPSPATTIAGGVVLDPGIEPRRRLIDLSALGKALEVPDEAARLSTFLSDRDEVPTSPLLAAWKFGIAPGGYADLIAKLVNSGELVRLGPKNSVRVIHRHRLEQIAAGVLKRIRSELTAIAPRRSLPRQDIVTACRNLGPPDLIDAAFEQLLKEKKLVSIGQKIGPADAQVQLSKNQTALRARILDRIASAGLMPPTAKELIAELKERPEMILPLLTLCTEDGLLIEVADGLFLTPAALETARRTCDQTLNRQKTATMSQLREAWGVTRKFSVPLCEFFDARKITIRDGDLRRAGPQLGIPIS